MDYPVEEGSGISVLGELNTGDVGRTVYGGGGDLWGSDLYQICCKWVVSFPGSRGWLSGLGRGGCGWHLSVLGKHDTGKVHSWETVYGGGGDLWGCDLCQICCKFSWCWGWGRRQFWVGVGGDGFLVFCWESLILTML